MIQCDKQPEDSAKAQNSFIFIRLVTEVSPKSVVSSREPLL